MWFTVPDSIVRNMWKNRLEHKENTKWSLIFEVLSSKSHIRTYSGRKYGRSHRHGNLKTFVFLLMPFLGYHSIQPKFQNVLRGNLTRQAFHLLKYVKCKLIWPGISQYKEGNTYSEGLIIHFLPRKRTIIYKVVFESLSFAAN